MPSSKRKSSPARRRVSSSPSAPKQTESVKFFDLIAKKPFMSSDYNIVTINTNSRNGRRKVTYFVTTNPTPRNDGKMFENWKIYKNQPAM